MNSQKTEKKRLFTKLKKKWFHKSKVRFLKYVVSAQRVQIKDEKIDVVEIGLNQNLWKTFRFFSILQIFIDVLSKTLV